MSFGVTPLMQRSHKDIGDHLGEVPFAIGHRDETAVEFDMFLIGQSLADHLGSEFGGAIDVRVPRL
jgi:hypothetical protein